MILNAARKWLNDIPVVGRRGVYFGITEMGEGRESRTGKTAGSETSVPMTPIVRTKLQAHLVDHTHQLVVPNVIGRPFNGGRVVKKILHPILDKLGISRKGRRIGHHAFRHSLASMLLQTTGVHSDASFTVLVYGHVLGHDHT